VAADADVAAVVKPNSAMQNVITIAANLLIFMALSSGTFFSNWAVHLIGHLVARFSIKPKSCLSLTLT
jgi:hypothetical protein